MARIVTIDDTDPCSALCYQHRDMSITLASYRLHRGTPARVQGAGGLVCTCRRSVRSIRTAIRPPAMRRSSQRRGKPEQSILRAGFWYSFRGRRITGVFRLLDDRAVVASYRLGRPDSAFTPVNVRMTRNPAGTVPTARQMYDMTTLRPHVIVWTHPNSIHELHRSSQEKILRSPRALWRRPCKVSSRRIRIDFREIFC